jgi:threonine aldolase
VIAAAGIYALENNVERLAEDHANAKALAEGLAELPGLRLDPATVETNIVIFEVANGKLDATQLCEAALTRHGVRMSQTDRRHARAVTHLHVSRSGIDAALEAISDVLRG